MIKLTIKRDTEWQEWIAKLSYKGAVYASYHTDNKEEALDNGLMMFYQSLKHHNQTGFKNIDKEIQEYKKAYS